MRGALKRLLAPDASGEATYALLVRKAGEKAGADAKQLLSIRRSIPDDDWNDVAASVIRQLGKPTAGAADPLGEGFSVSTYLTTYERLSDAGKDVIFGGAGREALCKEMDTLANVVAAQKRVLRLGNPSGTGRVVGTAFVFSALGASAAVGNLPTTAAAVGASYLGARAMMSPRFVRWLYTSPTTALGSKAWTRHLANLQQIVAQDDSLRPVADAINASLA